MIYTTIALKSEAQAFVDKYKMQKLTLGKYSLFYNDRMKIIVSGIGVINAREATQMLINQYDINDDDIYLNIGICGATMQYNIGSLIEIGEVLYDGIPHLFCKRGKSLVCVDEAIHEAKYDLADMESYGFLDAVIHSPAIKKFHIFKVVSDHFKPQSVTKDKTKSLIFNMIDDINKLLVT